ncbi:MAG: glycosyltransferase family 2 protein [Gemmatimonadota bacterium]
MRSPLVSCVIPVYNGERYLGEAIDSILAQTHPVDEIVVVDDGSTDGSSAVAKGYGDPVLCVRQDNAGPSAASNRGIEAAGGDVIAFLDADDLWRPEKNQRQLARLEASPEVAAVFGHVLNFWVEELREEAERFRDHRIARPTPGFVRGTMTVRREALDSVGRFDPKSQHGEVQQWILRARERDLVLEMLPDVLLDRRLHRGNRSRSLRDPSREEFLRLVKQNLDRKRDR